MKVITDIKFFPDWPYTVVTIVKQEVIIDDSGAIIGFGEPEVEEIAIGPS